jgi:hypothetical protein
MIDKVQTLLDLKLSGIREVRINLDAGAGIWNKVSRSIVEQLTSSSNDSRSSESCDIELKDYITRMEDASRRFKDKYNSFQSIFNYAVHDIKKNAGKMDMENIMGPAEDMVRFLIHSDPSYSFLIRTPLASENYLFSHSYWKEPGRWLSP